MIAKFVVGRMAETKEASRGCFCQAVARMFVRGLHKDLGILRGRTGYVGLFYAGL